jgi:hypothetical protein
MDNVEEVSDCALNSDKTAVLRHSHFHNCKYARKLEGLEKQSKLHLGNCSSNMKNREDYHRGLLHKIKKKSSFLYNWNMPRITGFLDFVHRPEFFITRKHNVTETGSVSILRRGKIDTYSVGSLRLS